MKVIPEGIVRILATTALAGLLLALYWAQRDWRGALVFSLAVAWAMANLAVWSAFSRLILGQIEGKGLLLGALGLGKVLLIVAGLVALKAYSPLPPGGVVGLVLGLSLCLIISLLMAVGARVTGREMSDGLPGTDKKPDPAGNGVGDRF